MNLTNFWHQQRMVHFKQWMHTRYAVFNTLNREIRIGFLLTAYFTCLGYQSTFAKTETDSINTKINLEEVEVSARRGPTLYSEAGRIVTVLSRAQIEKLPVQSVPELLRMALSVDIRERGPLGMQADISMRGGSFDQVMILLNGVNVTDPQTGHHALNLPVSLESIERVEILQGPAARVYGPNAFNGAINFITTTSDQNGLSVSGLKGSHNLFNGQIGLRHRTGSWKHYFSAQKGNSDGYRDNTDFELLNLFYNGRLSLGEEKLSFQLGYNEKAFGANSFYSATYPNQFEATRTLFGSLSMETGERIRIRPNVYWRRHHDRFELFRGNKNAAGWYAGHNYHLTDVAGANVNASTDWALGTTSVGGEVRGEAVWSNVLGLPLDEPMDVPGEPEGQFTRYFHRGNISLFGEHNFRVGRLNVSGGLLMNRHSQTGYGVDWYPGLDVSYWILPGFKWMAAYNKSLRMPTFTDLFYSGPTNEGNAQLKPEEAQTIESAFRWRSFWHDTQLGGFYRKGENLIDWGRRPGEEKYTTSNINEVEALGLEFSWQMDFQAFLPGQNVLQTLAVNYSYTWQDLSSDEGYESYYVLDHLRQKLNIGVSHGLGLERLSAQWNMLYRDRAGYYKLSATDTRVDYEPFWLTDVRVMWQQTPQFRMYAEATNLLDTKYADMGELTQPGRWIKVGFSYTFNY
ncbi:TonB-dependent receptor [Geofilum rubicundum]|uniref:TonB-dependent receptor n=1 Tax=Geofilum rubicundum JCM 15548 TaxID=1236989 RepID=A0A0E9LY59_9BACT|nr:TonB-dependent receptor [Geofilum rubicundum]GAO30497.1 TonB-dependent receptor [Geofilum rubicundum JCM 15548]